MGIVRRVIRGIVGQARPLRCVHCARTREPGRRFISGPNIYICESCGADAAVRFGNGPPETTVLRCSFCWKESQAVTLGAQRDHAICGDCVQLVTEIFAEADEQENAVK